jgi:hypothetical protein
MKTYVHLWQYLTEFFLEWEMFQTKVVEKTKTHILCSITFFRKSCRLWDNVEKCGTARQATDDNITRRMRFACWITKATDTHSEYVILIVFPRQHWLRERASILRSHIHYLSCITCIRVCTGHAVAQTVSFSLRSPEFLRGKTTRDLWWTKWSGTPRRPQISRFFFFQNFYLPCQFM